MTAPDPIAEAETIADWKAGDILAGGRLLKMHEGQIRSIVHRYVTPRCELDDLLQVGRMALLDAAMKKDDSRARLFTFAFLRIHQAARRHARSTRYVAKVSEYADGKRAANPNAVWLDAPIGDGGDTVASRFIAPAEDPIATADAELLVSTLPERERGVMRRLFFGAGETLEEVAASLGVSAQRIWKIKTEALAMLRERVTA